MTELKLDTEEDLFELINLMPVGGRYRFMRILQDMRNNKIDAKEATKLSVKLLEEFEVITLEVTS